MRCDALVAQPVMYQKYLLLFLFCFYLKLEKTPQSSYYESAWNILTVKASADRPGSVSDSSPSNWISTLHCMYMIYHAAVPSSS